MGDWVYDKPCGSNTYDDKPCDSDTLFDCNEGKRSTGDSIILNTGINLNDTPDTVLYSQSETDSGSDSFNSVQYSENENSNTFIYSHSNLDPGVSGIFIYSEESFEIREISSINTNTNLSSDKTIKYDLFSEGLIRIIILMLTI